MQDGMTLFTLFILGFFGGTHCVGMCGGLSTAFALQLPPHIKRIWLILLLNVGRMCSYIVVGTLMGVVSQAGGILQQTHYWQLWLAGLADLLLLFTGLYLAGVSHFAAKIENLGKPLWRKFNPLLNKLLPIRSVPACFAVGVLWGWLPCGLVYNASLYALGSGSAIQGALYLAAFGLGTLPNLLAMGFFAVQLQTLLHRRIVRFCAGSMVAGWAIWQLMTLLGVV
ncbi:MAG: sulfite exporter TauE/SafE family protein [Alysiella sp.]|uniref:sulfite exporter TauE/SafE family protein n=1 Tax=Alysiella sp. TaxID=1872483 RepID=UPI0026DD96C4|nr:sulfite exporter TauE/SafE family protein [Alysiella sp.]MDO4433308.1 sulfite exporter TauE/SafE family protein [Alysiella sp.]